MKKSAIEIIVSDLIERATTEGILPWHKPWRDLAVAQQNLMSGHKYRGVNLFLLMCEQRSPFFATFGAVKKAGGQVVKGAKGYKVVLYKPLVKTDKSTGEEKKAFMLRYYTVFNHADMDGIEAPEMDTETELREHIAIDQCEQIIEQWGDKPTILHGGDRAYYQSMADTVTMPTPEQFISASEYYSTLFHELAHATGHKSRLDRELGNGFGSLKYSREELVAELTACLLRVHCQIDDQRIQDNSVAYLQGWSKALEKEPTMFTYAAAKAQAAFDMIAGIELQ